MNRLPLVIVIAFAALVQVTNGMSESRATGVVRGTVFMSPVCPGPARPGRIECQKRPVQATVRVFRAAAGNDSAEERPLTTVTTDGRGQFRLELPAGAYRLVPIPPRGIAVAKPVDIAVTAGSIVTVDLSIDTGLR